jgi:chemotaxis protein MotB
MLGRLVCVVAAASLCGCLVPRVDHRAEVSRVRALEYDRELTEARLDELTLQIRNLEKRGQNLELERQSLDEERITLLRDLENLRVGNDALALELVREREIRESRETEIAALSGTYQSLVDELEKEIEAGQIEIHRLKGRLQVRALDRILFDSGRTQIKPEGQEVLAKVAVQLRKLEGHRVRVEGHTDNVPIATERFPSNWELSAARAAGVVRFLMEQGLAPDELSAEGFGPYQPIAANDTAENRARNRRIEIVLVPDEE